MASVSVVKRRLGSGGTSYYVKWRDSSGTQKMERAQPNTSEAAKEKAAIIRKTLRETGDYRAPDTNTSLREYALGWVESADIRPTARAEYKRLLESETGFVNEYGHLPIAAVRREHIRSWMAGRAKQGASRHTIRNGIAPVRAALSQALTDQRIAYNPAQLDRRAGGRSAIPGKAPEKIVSPERATVEKALAGASDEFRLVMLLAASCGLRRGEIYGLKWGDFADEYRTVKVSRSNTAGVLSVTKTEAGERDVPVFARVRAELLEHLMRSQNKSAEALVFPDPVGRPQHPALAVRRELKAAFAKAELPELAFRFHALRHHAVSALIAEGARITLVSKVAGHSSPDVTLRVYSHLLGEDLRKAADLYDPLRVVV